MTAPKLTLHRRAFTDLTPLELHELLRLRTDVFVVEQTCAYPELDGRDAEPGAEHWWVEVDGVVVCCLRLLTEPDGSHRIGRVATRADHRGAGLAARLVGEAAAAVEGTIHLHAQAHLQGWYEQLGFVVCGAGFMEDGIPHVPMVRP